MYQQAPKQQTKASRLQKDIEPPAQYADAPRVAAACVARVVSAESLPLDDAHFPALATAAAAAQVC